MSPGPARVLHALRSADGPCSGEALSTQLGVSRAQIWKHVETLRKHGYEIAGEPGGGYRLIGTPDRLFPEEIDARLETTWLGRRIEYLEETDSTNRVAHDLAQAGAEHGTAVIAEGQTAGRGRLGRRFFSPPYLNLYTSIVLRPRLGPAEAPTLIPAAAIAVAETLLAEVAGAAEVEIKWPNDVLLDGLKACGILMEMQVEATQVGFAVLGIGVNLNVERASFPSEFRAHATSLRTACGREIDRVAFACQLYSILEQVLDEHARGGFASLRSRYEALFRMRGRRVRVVAFDGGEGSEIQGTVHGIDHDGALLLDREGATGGKGTEPNPGEPIRVIAGDVTLAKEAPPT